MSNSRHLRLGSTSTTIARKQLALLALFGILVLWPLVQNVRFLVSQETVVAEIGDGDVPVVVTTVNVTNNNNNNNNNKNKKNKISNSSNTAATNVTGIEPKEEQQRNQESPQQQQQLQQQQISPPPPPQKRPQSTIKNPTTDDIEKRFVLGANKTNTNDGIIPFLDTKGLIQNVKIHQDRFRPEYAPFMLNTSYHYNTNNAIVGNHNIDDDNKATGNNIKPVRIRIILFEGPKVRFRPGPTGLIGDEVLNICMDGFEKSPYFELVGVSEIPRIINDTVYIEEDDDDDVVWVVEMRLMEQPKRKSIPEQTIQLVRNTREYQKRQLANRGTTNSTLSSSTSSSSSSSSSSLPLLRVIFMDYRDRLHNHCHRNKAQPIKDLVELLGGPQNLREMRQQIVFGREWDATRNFPKLGRPYVIPFGSCWQYFPIHSPYTVRTDFVEHVLKYYQRYLPGEGGVRPNVSSSSSFSSSNGTSISGLHPPTTSSFITKNNSIPSVVDTVRPTDVAHFWSRQRRQANCHLRDAVTDVVLSLNNTLFPTSSSSSQEHNLLNNANIDIESNTTTTNNNDNNANRRRMIQVIGESISISGKIGRTSLQDAYIDALMTTKIVVVAQRDSWEDHYRFFEAIVGGGLVLTDPMISLPEGYANTTNVVIYDSLESLKSLILYYLEHEEERLEIARRGWELAMRRHRSYHWMETLFFGKPLTP